MNWGHGITIFLILFVSFMGTLVYLTTQSSVDLEVENYYEQELVYQDQIVARANGTSMKDKLNLHVGKEELTLTFLETNTDLLDHPQMVMYRANDAKLDRRFDLSIINGTCTISREQLIIGAYEARITWSKDGQPYAIHQKIVLD